MAKGRDGKDLRTVGIQSQTYDDLSALQRQLSERLQAKVSFDMVIGRALKCLPRCPRQGGLAFAP